MNFLGIFTFIMYIVAIVDAFESSSTLENIYDVCEKKCLFYC